jgi:hypothetical protein
MNPLFDILQYSTALILRSTKIPNHGIPEKLKPFPPYSTVQHTAQQAAEAEGIKQAGRSSQSLSYCGT